MFLRAPPPIHVIMTPLTACSNLLCTQFRLGYQFVLLCSMFLALVTKSRLTVDRLLSGSVQFRVSKSFHIYNVDSVQLNGQQLIDQMTSYSTRNGPFRGTISIEFGDAVLLDMVLQLSQPMMVQNGSILIYYQTIGLSFHVQSIFFQSTLQLRDIS